MQMQIKKMREKRNITQIDMANSLGVTQGLISQWESGNVLPRSEKLPALAKILDCTIDDLYIKAEPAPLVSPDVENDPEWAAKRAWIRERMTKQLFGDGPPRL